MKDSRKITGPKMLLTSVLLMMGIAIVLAGFYIQFLQTSTVSDRLLETRERHGQIVDALADGDGKGAEALIIGEESKWASFEFDSPLLNSFWLVAGIFLFGMFFVAIAGLRYARRAKIIARQAGPIEEIVPHDMPAEPIHEPRVQEQKVAAPTPTKTQSPKVIQPNNIDRTGTPIIEARNLTKSYFETETEVKVLSGVDLRIYRGDMMGIIGPSGVGKTTLLYMLGTLEKPTEGRVLFGGEDVFTKRDDVELADFRNKKIGFVFQFHHLIPEFSAVENVMMPCLLARIPKAEAKDRAMEAMRLLGVDHRKQHRPGELSGGEQQRVAVARALVMKPDVVLADEPTGNLDMDTSEHLHERFLELNQENGITFVIVTHNESLADQLPRVIKLDRGQAYAVKG